MSTNDNPPAAETREFELPIRLAIGDREIEVPITVSVTFDALHRMVERHLTEQEDLYTQLMEHYADQAGRKKSRKPTAASEPRASTAKAKEAPAPESNGGSRSSRKKAPAPAPEFTEEELAEWRGKLPPPHSGRGKKSRDRQLWEAANPDTTD